MPPRQRFLWIAGIALWAVATCFNRLGDAPVYVTNEAREGVYVRAMLQSGNFIVPLVPNHIENGEVVPDKPPLFHWLSAAAVFARSWLHGRALGPGEELAAKFDEWTLRFPSALTACVMVIAIAVLGAGLVGDRAACFAAAALLTSWQLNYQARLGRVDMALACFVTIGVLVAGRAILGKSPLGASREPDQPSPTASTLLTLAGLATGLAVLAKGPLGIVLPSVACGAYLVGWSLVARAPHQALRFRWRRAVVAAAIVAVPWYLIATPVSGGAVFRSQLLAENVGQFTGVNGAMTSFYYVWPWLLDSFPWNLIACLALVEVWKTRHPGASFCAVWWLSLLALFQVAAYKRRAYLLPALPAEALLAGWLLDRRLPKAAGWGRGGAEVPTFSLTGSRAPARSAGLALLVCAAMATVGWTAAPVASSLAGSSSWSRTDGAFGLAGIAAMTLCAVAFARAIRARDRGFGLAALWGFLAASYVAVYPGVATALAEGLSVKRLMARVEAELPPDRGLTICGVGADASLVILLYSRAPQRINVVPDDELCPKRLPVGFYLLAAEQWRRMREAQPDDGSWRERLGGEIRGWSARLPVVLVERLPTLKDTPKDS